MSATSVATRPSRTFSKNLHRPEWWLQESPVDLHDAPAVIKAITGREVSLATVRRWVRVGTLGVRLRAFASGGRQTSTTREELARFLAALASIRGLI